MLKPRRTKDEISADAAAERRVHAEFLGYQPRRMKPVHFATSFLLSLTGRQHELELLNKASVPKAAPRDSRSILDEYVSDRLYPKLVELNRLSDVIDQDAFRALRAHLNAAYNNDGAALNAAFAPYNSPGTDFSTPSLRYVSNKSKNHGYAGTFVVSVLEATPEGTAVLAGCRRLLDAPPPPLADFGAPLLDDFDEPFVDRYDEQFGTLDDERLKVIAAEMHEQTKAIGRLVENLKATRSAYALRFLIIGLCSWLFVYMMKRGAFEPLLLIDALQGGNPRIRAQSRASYARQLDLFSASYDRQWDRKPAALSASDWSVFAGSADARQNLDNHFRDLGVRIGFVQPRAPSATRKHIEIQADTLRVLVLSLIAPGQIMTLSDLARALRGTWRICVGADAEDAQLLRAQRFGPLDSDEDLQPNAASFQALLVRLGLAVEPSDGLTLCAIDAEDLI
ncbi:hypothetical protein NKI59_27020 [Mesorhizobium sp. M0598]|uniref:hypothetical protein n=1 Tax=Mesorhizobium sp. M0598 TaxID=2956968 RepID=UPI00333932A9